MKRPATVVENSMQVALQASGKKHERLDAAFRCPLIPSFPESKSVLESVKSPQLLEVILEQVHRKKIAVGFQQFLEAKPVIALQVFA